MPTLTAATARPRAAVVPIYGAVNTDYAAGRDREHVEHLTEQAHALGMVECKHLDVAQLLPEGWTAHQVTGRGGRRRRTSRDQARAGNAIALRDDVLRARPGERLKLRLGVRPWIRGRRVKMLTRYIACLPAEHVVTGELVFLVVVHFPPERYRALWRTLARRLRRIIRRHPNVVVLTDANMSAEQLAELLNLPTIDYFGREVMAVLWNRDRHQATATGTSTWGRRHDATGHPSVLAELDRKGTR